MLTWRLAALVMVVFAVVGCARAAGDAFQSTVTDAVRVDDGGLGQTFTPGADALAGIDLLTATYGEPADPDGELVVSVVDEASSDVVATAEASGDEVRDNEWVSLRFDESAPAPEAAALLVEWTGESPVGLWANVPPADIDPDERLINDPYAGGRLVRDGEPAAGDLAFRVVGEVGATEPVRALARLAAGVVVSLMAVPAFGVVWVVAMLGAVALAVAGFRGASATRE